MRKYILVLFSLLLALLAIIISKCTPEACFEETNAFLKASLYDNETKMLKSPDSLTVYGISIDSVKIYDKAKRVQPALLPLDASTSACTFIVIINGIADTVTFSYDSYPHLISRECGYSFFHNIDTPVYTTHIIDYIFTGQKNITTENVENIRIFY
jgi:hypothetical protein